MCYLPKVPLPVGGSGLFSKEEAAAEESLHPAHLPVRLAETSCKAQCKGEEDKADKGRGGKTTSGNGQAWSSASPRGQWRTGKNGENWLQNHL